jgi:hypothetical protein
MMPPPQLREPVLLFLFAALLGSLAWKVTWWSEWLRMFLVFGASIFLFFGIASTINLVAFVSAARIRELNRARVAGVHDLAIALKGLTPKQTDMVARHDVIEIAGILGNDSLEWTIHAPGGDIPWEFMVDFLRKSQETEPYLWPIRKHDELDWQDSENQCTIATNLLIHSREGWAEKAAGPYSAKLTTSLELVAAYFGVEL